MSKRPLVEEGREQDEESRKAFALAVSLFEPLQALLGCPPMRSLEQRCSMAKDLGTALGRHVGFEELKSLLECLVDGFHLRRNMRVHRGSPTAVPMPRRRGSLVLKPEAPSARKAVRKIRAPKGASPNRQPKMQKVTAAKPAEQPEARQPKTEEEERRLQQLRRLRLELAEAPASDAEGGFLPKRMSAVAGRLVAEQLEASDWAQLWSALKIGEHAHTAALSIILEQEQASDAEVTVSMADVVVQLVRAHRVKLGSLEEAFAEKVPQDLAVDGRWASRTPGGGMRALLAQGLVNLCPADWGWTWPGWTWSTWWACLERCLAGATAGAALSILSATLWELQERCAVPLLSWKPFQVPSRIAKLREKVQELEAELDLGESASQLQEFMASLSPRAADLIPEEIDLAEEEEQAEEAAWYSRRESGT
eukprot:TRINITY_DN61124_c0_g1_i1.p1 TRINITY_DN61124_c0_g1~~TRINITY_DN61124_c0_g1_i1.p1  ORF type:complete len:423 (-),score=102.96 TRINITY_DN61124_c0_g1_i1:18-1286(-)